MFTRLGKFLGSIVGSVFYWIGCGLAVVVIARAIILSITSGGPAVPLILGGVGLIVWLIGMVQKYSRKTTTTALGGHWPDESTDGGGSSRQQLGLLESDPFRLKHIRSLSQIPSGWRETQNRMILCGMLDLCRLILAIVIDLFQPRAAVEAEILVLRQQIIVLRRGRPGRVPLLAVDRIVLGWVCQLFPKTREALAIVRPDTVVRWHRAGFRRYWRWKSRRRSGRRGVLAEIRQLIREMSVANPLWGAPRIHGELVKLGIDIGQTSVAKYMARKSAPPSQGWKTFLRNHADGIAAMDLFVVPTVSFRLLYGLLIMGTAGGKSSGAA